MRERLLILGGVLLLLLTTAWLWPKDHPAKISLPNPRQPLRAGQEFEIPLLVSVPRAINAGEFYFSFPKELVEVERIKKDDSIYQLWITGSPTFDNDKGTISLAGGLPTPGFIGQDGLVATLVLKAKKSGTGLITLDQSRTRLLANDGQGSQVSASFQPLTLKIK